MILTRAFEPDEDYDRTHASNGVSCYGTYLGQHVNLFVDDGKPTADAEQFAAAAWRVAQDPTLYPGYVQAHGRVRATTVQWDEHDRPTVCAELVVSSPQEAACLAYPWRCWTVDELGYWVPPADYARPNTVAVLRVAVPLAEVSQPRPCYQGNRPGTTTAKHAMEAICRTVNAALAHVLAFDPLTGNTR